MPAPTITSRSAVSREGILRTCVQPQMLVPKTPSAQDILDRNRRLGGSAAARRHSDLEIAHRQDIPNPSRQPDLLSRVGHHHRAPAATVTCGAAVRARRHDAHTTTHPCHRPGSANPRRTRTQRRLCRREEQTAAVLTADSRRGPLRAHHRPGPTEQRGVPVHRRTPTGRGQHRASRTGLTPAH
jgi:hypothetical protein